MNDFALFFPIFHGISKVSYAPLIQNVYSALQICLAEKKILKSQHIPQWPAIIISHLGLTLQTASQ